MTTSIDPLLVRAAPSEEERAAVRRIVWAGIAATRPPATPAGGAVPQVLLGQPVRRVGALVYGKHRSAGLVGRRRSWCRSWRRAAGRHAADAVESPA